jgi:hypothetical protein
LAPSHMSPVPLDTSGGYISDCVLPSMSQEPPLLPSLLLLWFPSWTDVLALSSLTECTRATTVVNQDCVRCGMQTAPSLDEVPTQ